MKNNKDAEKQFRNVSFYAIVDAGSPGIHPG
jgi:hypothetical protein